MVTQIYMATLTAKHDLEVSFGPSPPWNLQVITQQYKIWQLVPAVSTVLWDMGHKTSDAHPKSFYNQLSLRLDKFSK